MSIAFIVLCLSFVSMLLLGVPIVSVIAISSTIAIMATGREPLEISSTSMAHGVDSFALLAIPFFISLAFIVCHLVILINILFCEISSLILVTKS